jgi:hypothetical protein
MLCQEKETCTTRKWSIETTLIDIDISYEINNLNPCLYSV